MENNVSIRIYIKDGKLEQLVPEFPWEGQIDVQVIVHDEYLDPKEVDGICEDKDCPEAPDPNALRQELHYHDYFSTAVIRAESMQPLHAHEYEAKPDGSRRLDANCGAYVCLGCGDHEGLARCYCGWATDGGNGVAQLQAMGENVEDDY